MRDVFGLMDFTLTGGFVKGERLFGFFNEHHNNPDIEALEQRFVSVATEMQSGREIWITRGPVWAAARASCAMPGLFTPVKHEDRWRSEEHPSELQSLMRISNAGCCL